MKEYEISITGSGTAEQIAEALHQVANEIQSTNEIESGEWEDPILMTEINEL